jgi:hypothetical protein
MAYFEALSPILTKDRHIYVSKLQLKYLYAIYVTIQDIFKMFYKTTHQNCLL